MEEKKAQNKNTDKKNADGTFTSKEVEKKKGSVSSIISEAKRDLELPPHRQPTASHCFDGRP